MILSFRFLMFVVAIITGMVTSYSVFAQETVFDRLDGHGPSGKRVDVIEWDGNLEIHVYPKGSLGGLSAKLDDREQGKNVMVIGYRIAKGVNPLVRRAILGIPFNKNLMGFIDRSEPDFDKLAISNQQLSKPWAAYKLDPSPKQWYPDGHELNEEAPTAAPLAQSDGVLPASKAATTRAPASVPTKVVTPDEKSGETDSLNHFNW
jgi:hypothetical protein